VQRGQRGRFSEQRFQPPPQPDVAPPTKAFYLGEQAGLALYSERNALIYPSALHENRVGLFPVPFWQDCFPLPRLGFLKEISYRCATTETMAPSWVGNKHIGRQVRTRTCTYFSFWKRAIFFRGLRPPEPLYEPGLGVCSIQQQLQGWSLPMSEGSNLSHSTDGFRHQVDSNRQSNHSTFCVHTGQDVSRKGGSPEHWSGGCFLSDI